MFSASIRASVRGYARGKLCSPMHSGSANRSRAQFDPNHFLGRLWDRDTTVGMRKYCTQFLVEGIAFDFASFFFFQARQIVSISLEYVVCT